MDQFTRRRILVRSEAVLKAAGVQGLTPTPLDLVSSAAGVLEVVDMSELPPELEAQKPARWKRIMGAYLFKAETVFLDRSQGLVRGRFIQAHEVGHRILPWQQEAFFLDDKSRLFRDTEEKFEQEANLAAAHILFQGTRFHQLALEYEDSIDTPVLLADRYDASFHATIRYYAEHHPEPVALAIAGVQIRRDGTVPVWTTVESPTFLQEFGSLAQLLGGSLQIRNEPKTLGVLAGKALGSIDSPTHDGQMSDLCGQNRPYTAGTFSNRHTLFVLLTPRRRLRAGRRVRVSAS